MRNKATLVAALVAVVLAACAGTLSRGDGLDETKLPDDMRDNYRLFAQRCSKCHALSRALDSGIEEDEFWERYVERMRRQPASGIELRDEPPILRFLHYYSAEKRRQRAAKNDASSSSVLPAPPPSPSGGTRE